MLEADKAKQLSEWFQVPVAADQVHIRPAVILGYVTPTGDVTHMLVHAIRWLVLMPPAPPQPAGHHVSHTHADAAAAPGEPASTDLRER